MNGGPAWLEPREDNAEAPNEPVAENLVNEGGNQVGIKHAVHFELYTPYALRNLSMNSAPASKKTLSNKNILKPLLPLG